MSGIAPEPAAPVAIVAALPEEIAPLRAQASDVRRLALPRGRAWEGRLDGRRVIFACTGDGVANAEAGARALLERMQVGWMIVLGVSGALSPALSPHGIVVGEEVRDGTAAAPAPDGAWVRWTSARHGAKRATLVSSPEILGTPEEKARCYRTLPSGTIAAVDLESAAFAREAGRRGIPYVALRSISDASDEWLPLDFNRLRRRDGGVARLRVAAAAARTPSAIVPLWRLRRRVNRCAVDLARFVRGLLAGGGP
jgi:nucleoside phosphorylase